MTCTVPSNGGRGREGVRKRKGKEKISSAPYNLPPNKGSGEAGRIWQIQHRFGRMQEDVAWVQKGADGYTNGCHGMCIEELETV